MKHLIKYSKLFESHVFVDYVKDILLDLGDDDIGYDVELKSDGRIVVILSLYKSSIKLGSVGPIIEHLFSYLESIGYVLGGGSYYENEGWDLYERCPKCNGVDIIMGESDNSECVSCGYKDYYDEFQTMEYPIDKSELMFSIRHNYYINFMYLEFRKAI